MLGCWTEPFNRLWYEKLSGQRVDRLVVALTCPTNPWRRCTLDGYIVETDAIWEAKHTNAFAKSEEVLERYMPQLQHNMAVARVERAILSVIFGNHKYEMFEVASDWVYQIELLQAEIDFWDCVQTGREPVPAPPPAPPRPIGVREVCLEGNNGWAAAAADWLGTSRGGQAPCGRLQPAQGAGRARRRPGVRPWHRGQAQQGRGDHHPGAQRMTAPHLCAARLPGDQRRSPRRSPATASPRPTPTSSTSTSIARSTIVLNRLGAAAGQAPAVRPAAGDQAPCRTEPVQIKTAIGIKRVSRIEALLMKAIDEGGRGQLRAIDKLFAMYAAAVPEPRQDPGAPEPANQSELSAADEAIIGLLRAEITAELCSKKPEASNGAPDNGDKNA